MPILHHSDADNVLPMSKLSLKWSELAPWIAGALVALTVSWAADGIREVVEAWAKGEAIQRWMIVTHLLYVVLFISCGCLAIQDAKAHLPATHAVPTK
jgi:hypothetical protein